MNILAPLELHEVETFLKCLKPETILSPGFGMPHPYYDDSGILGLVPMVSTTVKELLNIINSLKTTKLQFPDGEEIGYYGTSFVYIASRNHRGVPLTLEILLMSVESWMKIGEGFGRTH